MRMIKGILVSMLFLLVFISFSGAVSAADVNGTNNSADITPPTVVSVDPVNKAVNVSVDKVITVNFSEPIKSGNNWIELQNSNGTMVPVNTSINDNTLTVKPVNTLKNATNYALLIHTGSVTDLAGNKVAGYVSRFTTTSDGTAPTVANMDPTNNSVAKVDKVINVTFSEPIKAGNNRIELQSSNGTLIPITTSINGNLLTITSNSALTNGIRYVVLIHTGSVTDLAGNNVAGYVSRFTADGTAPTVANMDPVNNGVAKVDKVINVTFSEPIKAGNNRIELQSSNGTLIPITTSINGNLLTITSNSALTNGIRYVVLIHTGSVTDLAGNNVAGYVSRFTADGTAPTVANMDPVNNGVAKVDKVINVTFSEPIKAGNNRIELQSSNGTLIPITTSINGNLLTITSNSALTNGIRYVVLIHTGSVTDLAGNNVAGYVSRFTADGTDPVVTSNLGSGIYNTTQVVTLNATDNLDPNPIIYYTLDGTTPTTSSPKYTDFISIIKNNTILEFMAVDAAGNQAQIQTRNYTINLPIINLNTSNVYSTIQKAINDTLTSNGDTIEVQSGTYIENIVINKKLILKSKPGANVTLQSTAEDSPPVITINSGGSNSIIKGFNILGYCGEGPYSWGIYLNSANNCTIIGNNIINSFDMCGIELENSNNNTITGNNITGNWIGIDLGLSNNNTIQNNTVTDNHLCGISISSSASNSVSGNTITNNALNGITINNSSSVKILSNTITNNGPPRVTNDGSFDYNGIYLCNSDAIFNFNIITGNALYGLKNNGNGIINATNNWWGSNNPIVSSNTPSDIYNANGTVSYNPWLVLNVTATPTIVSNGNSTINVDITHNNQGNDTNPSGKIPDGIPVNVVTNLGTVTNTTYTKNGKASATFNPGNSTSGTATITTTIDQQNIQTNIIIDTTIPTVNASLPSGNYNTTQIVTLNATDNQDPNPIIYYTLDGTAPTTSSTKYVNAITITNTTTLEFMAVDNAGNQAQIQTNNYIIYKTPTVTASLPSGVYNTIQIVTLNATDNQDPNPTIYYTLDGTTPTTSSTIYTSPVTLQMNTTTRTITNLKFLVVDHTGHQGAIQNETYILTLPIVDNNNNNTYSTIQDAINNSSTLNGDVIQIYSGTYVETVIVNKKLTIIPVSGNNVTIKAANPNGNAFTITNSGNGSIIEGFTIKGNINLNANNCTIYLNTIIGNGTAGIIASNSFNNTILDNIITCNGFNGIQSNSSSNTIYGNTISGCESGIYSENSNDNITSNNLTNNHYGIWTYNSTDTIQFNKITGNTYGLRNDIGTVNETNNWWGSNANPSTISSDIYNESGTVIPGTWLVLSVTPSPTNSGGNTSVTADLTHNNTGGDTSSNGHVPDGIPVNFTTTFGTIIGSAYTVKGKATTILNLGNTQNATVTTTASVDNQTVSTTGVIATGVVVVNITGTSIDTSNNQPLNITKNIPLNESVTWISVIGIPGYNVNYAPADELKVIIDGTAVVDTQIYSTNDQAVDTLTINLIYPGVSGFNITVTDPNSTNNTNLTFPGNNIQRTSKITYLGSPYDFLQSFAIATTDVTNSVAQYWVNQASNYQSSAAMNAAYNAFLASLMVEYIHDQIADSITSQYNVTWSRTSPIIVSMGEDTSTMYLTLDCDHSMGMTVVGTPANMWAFNYITSFCIPFIEGAVMNASTNGTFNFNSVTMDLINAYLSNSTSLEVFLQNGFLIEKSGNEFLVIDPETGIVRDINMTNNLCGIGDDIAYERWVLEHMYDNLQRELLNPSQLFITLLNALYEGGGEYINIAPWLKIGGGYLSCMEGSTLIATGSVGMADPITSLPSYIIFGAGWVGVIGGAAAVGSGIHDEVSGPRTTNVTYQDQFKDIMNWV